jgi:hypothetical protein
MVSSAALPYRTVACPPAPACVDAVRPRNIRLLSR